MQTVGNYLKQEREAKNISLGEVAQLTKISEFYLDFLEKDDYEKLPQGPYIKGYISSYARLIGSNADEAIKLYNSLKEQTNQTEAAQAEQAEAVDKTAPIAFLGEKLRSSIKALSASLKTKTVAPKSGISSSEAIIVQFRKIATYFETTVTALKAATPSLGRLASSVKASFKTAGTTTNSFGLSLLKAISSVKKMAPSLKSAGAVLFINRRLFNWRTLLMVCSVLVSSGILVLAGFGFYHLFIYQKNPPQLAKTQTLRNDEAKTTRIVDTEKNAERSQTEIASQPTVQPVEMKTNKALSPLIEIPAGLKNLSPTSAPTAVASPDKRALQTAGIPSRSTNNKSVTVSESKLPAGKTPSEKVVGGKTSAAESYKKAASASPPPPAATATVLSVAEASICENVNARMPAGVQNSFPWSIPRVYAWSLIKAEKYPSKIRHIYYFGEQKISDVVLNIRSYSWRTWSYQSLADKRYRGPWRVDIATADGQVLRRLYFEVN